MARLKTKVCPGCQQLFVARPNAKTCSDRCRKRVFRAEQKAAQVKEAKTRQDITTGSLKTKVCPGCNRLFSARPNAKTCSDRCRKRVYRAKVAAAAVAKDVSSVISEPSPSLDQTNTKTASTNVFTPVTSTQLPIAVPTVAPRSISKTLPQAFHAVVHPYAPYQQGVPAPTPPKPLFTPDKLNTGREFRPPRRWLSLAEGFVIAALLLTGGFFLLIGRGSSNTFTSEQLSGVATANQLSRLAEATNTLRDKVNEMELNGGGIQKLNAYNVTSGTLNDARLSSNVELLDQNQIITGQKTYEGASYYRKAVEFTDSVLIQPTVHGSSAFTVASSGGGNILAVDTEKGVVSIASLQADSTSFGNTHIYGNTKIDGTLSVNKATTLSNTLSVAGSTTLSNTLHTIGGATFDNSLSVSGASSLGSSLNVAGPTVLGSTLQAGATSLASLSVLNNASVGGNLAATGDFNINSNAFQVVAASGNTTINGSLGVAGPVSLTNTLGVTGDLSVNTNKFSVEAVSGNTLVAGTLGVTGDLSVGSNSFVITAATGNTAIAGNLNVAGATTLGSLAVSGAAVFNSSVNVNGTGNVLADLTVTGATNLEGNVILGNTTANTLGINGRITTDLIANNTQTLNLGSPAIYWKDLYIANVHANNILAANTAIAGTTSDQFTINSDNVSADTEDMQLIFYRGTTAPNAILGWDSTLDRFTLNHTVAVTSGNLTVNNGSVNAIQNSPSNYALYADQLGTGPIAVFRSGVSSTEQLKITNNGTIEFGSAGDTNLYRAGVNTLQTNSDLVVGGSDLYVTNTSVNSSIINLQNTEGLSYLVGNDNKLSIGRTSPASNNDILVVDNTTANVSILNGGKLQFGPTGDGSQDVGLYRFSSGVLGTDSRLRVAGQTSYLDAGTATQIQTNVSGNAGFVFGSGGDTNLYRSGVNILKTDGRLFATGGFAAPVSSTVVATFAGTVSGDANNRFQILGGGILQWGDGTNPQDTNLYRSAANILKTDDSFNIQTASDSTTAFLVQNAAGTSNVLVADTTNGRIAINQATAAYPLDVVGDINTSSGLRVGGTLVCTISGCTSASGSGYYIQNTTAIQTANFAIQSAANTSVTAVIQGATSQSADILNVRDSSNTNLLRVDASGNTYVKGNLGFSNTGNANQALTLSMVVTSAVNAGDVVVIDTSNAGQVTASTTANSTKVFGIATQTQSAGVAQPIVISGIYQVNATGTVNVGDYLVTSSTTGQAQSSTSPTGGVIGQATATVSAGKVWARISPASGAGGGSGSGSSSSYGLMESDWVNTGATLPGTLGYSTIAIIGDYVYQFGGSYNGATTNIIFRAPVSNPTSWTNTGSTLPGNLYGSSLAIIGNTIYLFGGNNGSVYTNVIYSAPVSNPLSWTNTGATIPAGLGNSSLAIIGSYVYLFGGFAAGGPSSVIYRASISTPTTWTALVSTLPATLGASSLAVVGNYVYLFGGQLTGAGTFSGSIYRAPVSDPTSWVTANGGLAANNGFSNLVVIGNYIYLFGGYNGSGPLSGVYRAPVTNPLSWVSTGAVLPGALYGGSSAIIGGAVYMFGGSPLNSFTNVIYSAPIINGSPDISSNPSWKTATNIGSGGGISTASGSSSELTYAEFTSSVSVTATAEATANTVVTAPSVTFDGSSPVNVQFFAPQTSNSNAVQLLFVLYDGSSSVGILGTSPMTGAGNGSGEVSLMRRFIPSAGAHTYSVRSYVPSGTGTVAAQTGGAGNYFPGYIRITLANPNLQGGAGIQNGTTVQQANFNVQSVSSSSVTAVIQGATSQSADILNVRDSSNTNLLRVDASGNTYVKGNLGFSNTGNANQALTLSMVVTSAVNAGDVVVIDTSNAGQVTASTTANSTKVFGIATQTQSAGVAQPIVISGIYQVNATGTVNVGDYLVTSSTTGQAQSSTSPTGGVIGQATSTVSAGKVWARISPASGAGGGSGSGSSSSYGLMESDFVNAGTLSANISDAATATIGNTIYLFGGFRQGSGFVNSIYSAPVSNPTSWTTTGSTLPGVLADSSLAIIGDYIYLFGGFNGTAETNVIYRAPTSNPLSWSSVGTLPSSLYNSSIAVIGSNVYLYGGKTNAAWLSSIYSAPLSNPVSGWASAGTLPAQVASSSLAVVGNYVYLFGGVQGGVVASTIYRASISSPASFSSKGSLPGNLAYSNLAIVGNYIYLLGGDGGSGNTSVIYKAPVNNPAAWSSAGVSLPANFGINSSIVIAGNALYLFGTYLGSSTASNVIYSAPIINGSPDISSNPSWKTATNTGGSGGGIATGNANNSSQLAYAEFTSQVSVGATTEATATTVVSAPSATFDGASPVMVSFYAPAIYTYTGNTTTFVLYQDGSSIGQIGYAYGASSTQFPLNFSRELIPAAGAHTYSIRAYQQGTSPSPFITAGTGGSGASMPGYIRITLANPNLQGGAGIQNGTTVQQANFNVQSVSSSSVTAVIQGATSQSADILNVRDSSNTNLLRVDASGNTYVKGNLGFSNTGNANQVMTVNEVVTSSVSQYDVVAIDSNNAGQVTTSTLANNPKVFGVATATNSAGVAQPIAISGIYQVNVDTAAVNIGDYLVMSGTAGKATDSASSAAGVIGRAMSAKAAGSNGTVWVYITPSGGGSGGSSSNYGLMESDWVNTGATLPGALMASSTATIGNYVYLFGGYNGSAYSNVIYRAPVSNPTSWTSVGTIAPATNGLSYSSLAIVGSNIYLFGGQTSAGVVSSIFTATTADPLTWTNTGATLPGVLSNASLAVINSTIYLFGGSTNGTNAVNTIYSASVGSPTVWGTTGGATIFKALRNSPVVVVGNYVYMFGGYTGTGTDSGVYRAPISGPTAWTSSGALPTNNHVMSATVVGGYLYILGGYNTGPVNSIWRAPVSNPTNGWSASGSTLPGNLYASSLSIIGNAVYLFGGNNGSVISTIYSAPIFNGSPDVSSNPSWITASNYASSGGSGTSSQTANTNTEMAYSEFTSSVNLTSATEATANTIVTATSITTDGVSPLLINFYAPNVDTGQNTDNYYLFQDGVSIGSMGQAAIYASGVQYYRGPINLTRRIVPSAGAHTYSIRGTSSTNTSSYVYAGTGGVGQLVPGYIRISLANPSLQGGAGIANGTTTQTANFNVQSSSASNVTAVIQGASSQSADILQIKDGSGNILFSVAPTGVITLGSASATPNILVLGTKNTAGDPASCTSGGIYYNSSSASLRGCQGSGWTSLGSSVGTSFPATPLDGDQYTYIADATNGVYWTFTYRSATSKWIFTGGAPLVSQVATSESTTSTTYAALTTAGPSITLPFAGDYDIEVGYVDGGSSAGITTYMSYDIGATAAVNGDAIATSSPTMFTSTSRSQRKTGLTAVTLTAKYKASSGTGWFQNRWMKVTPVQK